MKIIISPAKQMRVDVDTFDATSTPIFLKQATEIRDYLQSLSIDELKKVWNVNDKLFKLNYQRLSTMNFNDELLTPAILGFDGLQYKYMSPDLFTQPALDFIQDNLRILSSFYGVLRPFDGIKPYRLEMRAKVHVNGTKNLHEFWNHTWFDELAREDNVILNLASKMYASQIEKYQKLHPEVRFITCIFGHYDRNKDKVIRDNTYAKMSRGEMVRFIAENQITDYKKLSKFSDFGYNCVSSSRDKLLFLREK